MKIIVISQQNHANSNTDTCVGPLLANKKAQLSLTNPLDANACQKLLKFNMLTTSLTILVYVHTLLVRPKSVKSREIV